MPDQRGLFLDLDGTLADSLGVMRGVFERFLRHHGIEAATDEFDRWNGPTLNEIVEGLIHEHQLSPDSDELLALYQRFIDEAYREVEPQPGAAELVKSARRQSWFVAVVTSNSEARTKAWLDRIGLLPEIHAVVSGDRVRNGKPSPELYELALAESGCSADHSLAVEDSRAGVEAAVAAGLRTFAYDPMSACHRWPPGVTSIVQLSEINKWL